MHRHARKIASCITAIAVVTGICQAVAFIDAPHASKAAASPATGTAGVFVPLQGEIMDTRNGEGGYSSPMVANQARSLRIEGGPVTAGSQASIPSGVSSVLVTVTTTNAANSGILWGRPSSSAPNATLLIFSQGSTMSNAAIVAVGDDGTIQLTAQAQTDLVVDVQGYYTDGNGSTAAGGYVPVTPKTLANTASGEGGVPKAPVGAGGTIRVPAGGVAGIPANASAVFVNIQSLNSGGSNTAGWLTPFPTGATRPMGALDYPGGADPYAMGTQVPLGANGQFDIYVGSGGARTWLIDVTGYFTAAGSAGAAFTPAVTQVYDSRMSPNVAVKANSTATVQVAGVAGLPLMGSGLSSVALNITTITGGSGYLRMWGHNLTEPPVAAVDYDPSRLGTVTNFYTVQLGTDGAVSVRNVSSTDVNIVLNLQGWYANAAAAIPSGQNSTQRFVDLRGSVSAGGGSYVTYQYRVGTTGGFIIVPTGDIVDSGSGSTPSSWPDQASGGSFPNRRWDLRKSFGAVSQLVQVLACYGGSANDASLVCSAPNDLHYTTATFNTSNSTQAFGPGTLSLNTGDYQVSATDASAASALGSLSVGRSLTTLVPATAPSTGPGAAAGVFGPGWSADLSGPDGGAADMTPVDHSGDGYLSFGDPGNGETIFVQDPSNGQRYLPEGDDSGDGTVVTTSAASNPGVITMKDADGTTTVWNLTSGSGASGVWQVQSVTQPGAAKTSYTYSAGLVSRITAATPDGGNSCTTPDTTPGCRSLILNNTSVTVGSSQVTRLTSITLSTPQTSGTANKVDVAQYDYDSAGRLIHAWDPRLGPQTTPPTTALQTTYDYDSNNRLTSLKPPGLSAYTFSYDSMNRISTITRPDPSGATATSTVVYDVPLSGASGARPDVTVGQTAAWGQTKDLPVDNDAVAIFGPDRVPTAATGSTPAVATAASVTATEWPFATVTYLDINGRTVDSANYGAGAWQIAATGFDDTGNPTWSLSPGNLAQALNPTADTDSYVAGKTDSAARAGLLSSLTSYDPLSPGKVLATFGPTHPIRLTDGSAIHGRTHVTTTYDEGAPNSNVNPATNQPYDLSTTVTTTAYQVDSATPADTAGADSQTTRTGYDPIDGSSVTGPTSGWTLGQATSSTVVIPNGTNLVTKTRYDSNGRVVEQRLPNDTASTGPRITSTSYYTSTGTGGSCVDPTRVGLVCATAPAGQPRTGAPLPVTTYGYDQFGNQTTKTETYGSGSGQVVRTTTVGYDSVERPTTTAIAVTPASAGGTALPAVTSGYSTTTGMPTTTSTTVGSTTTTLTTGYDNLGRKTKYTDATGTVSTTTYDLSGNVATANNGKHTTTYTTDSSSEHRGMITSEDLGFTSTPDTFAVSYDAAGNMSSETYPNGLVATRRFDNAGNLFSLTYAKDGSTWMAFTQDVNALGQIVHQTSPQSAQTFGFDAADRLTTVRDTYQNACTTRTYSYDTHSNRQTLTSNPAAGDGTCTTSTTPATTNYSYDDADRLTSDTTGGTTGSYTYDQLGRATLIPAGDAKSTGTRNTITGNLTVGYYANDLVATQQQGSSSIAFTLDPLQNRISTQAEGSTTTTNHYNDDADSPAWTSSGSTITEYATDPTGNLAATIQGGTVTLNLVNPHGDIIATCPDLANASGISTYSESTEFGTSRNIANTYTDYGWLGAKQRSINDLGGLTLMGVRLYSPSVGRFLSSDPVPGGNLSAYIYPDDPVNALDASGESVCYRNTKACEHYYFNQHGGGNRGHSHHAKLSTAELLQRYRDPNVSPKEKSALKATLKKRGVIASNSDPSGRNRGRSSYGYHVGANGRLVKNTVVAIGTVIVVGIGDAISGLFGD